MPCLMLPGVAAGRQCMPREESLKTNPMPDRQVRHCHAGTSCVNVVAVDFLEERG